MDFQAEYRSKLRTPAEAVRAVKNGDWVDYTSALGFPPLLDAALAARRDELHDVKVRGNLCAGPVQIVECDPEQAHFLYHTWHCSAYERRLCDRGLCYYTPMIFRNLAWYYREFLTVNVAMASVAPMDRHGYFNLSAATGVSRAILDRADIVILEVNEHLPRLRGGFDEVIHISDVDMVVLPGGIPGTPNLAANKTVTETCKAFAAAGKKVAAICAAPSVLASLGLLEGKNATAHAGFQDQLAGAIVHDEEVVVDDNITTSYGLGGAIPFALELVRQLAGQAEAERIRNAIAYRH